jgi:hypothetical protein
MWKRKRRPTEYVYLSVEKLRWLASGLGVPTTLLAPMTEIEAGGGAEVGLSPLGKISLEGRVKKVEIDWGQEARAVSEVLEKVQRRLGRLPDLERGDLIREGGWFKFHRDLKFGVGHADAGPPIKALVVVDRTSMPLNSLNPGLLLNGSIAHVLDPYATDELRAENSSRSGSGTERLFNWLEEVRQKEEAGPEASWGMILSRSEMTPPKTQAALDMYHLFAQEEWLAPFLAEPLMHGGPCEGIARASYLDLDDERSVVMGSPLFIRYAPLPN